MNFTVKKLLVLSKLIGIFVWISMGIFWIVNPPLARRVLPLGASDVAEYKYNDAFGSKYTQLLKAKIQESEFDNYASRIGLNRNFSTDPPDIVKWPRSEVDWWNPPDSLENARYYYQEGSSRARIAAYHGGYVYFAEFGW